MAKLKLKAPPKYCRNCSKLAYRSQTMAIRAVLEYSKERGCPLRIYPCPNKQGWHLTKTKRIEKS